MIYPLQIMDISELEPRHQKHFIEMAFDYEIKLIESAIHHRLVHRMESVHWDREDCEYDDSLSKKLTEYKQIQSQGDIDKQKKLLKTCRT